MRDRCRKLMRPWTQLREPEWPAILPWKVPVSPAWCVSLSLNDCCFAKIRIILAKHFYVQPFHRRFHPKRFSASLKTIPRNGHAMDEILSWGVRPALHAGSSVVGRLFASSYSWLWVTSGGAWPGVTPWRSVSAFRSDDSKRNTGLDICEASHQTSWCCLRRCGGVDSHQGGGQSPPAGGLCWLLSGIYSRLDKNGKWVCG